MSAVTAGLILAWVAIVLLTFANAGLLRQIAFLRASMDSRPGSPVAVGTDVPELARLQDLEGKPSVFIFAREGCPGCELLASELRMQDAIRDVGFLFEAEIPANVAANATPAWGMQSSVFEEYGVKLTPFAVLVRNGAIVDAKPAGSVERIVQLLDAGQEVQHDNIRKYA